MLAPPDLKQRRAGTIAGQVEIPARQQRQPGRHVAIAGQRAQQGGEAAAGDRQGIGLQRAGLRQRVLHLAVQHLMDAVGA